MDTKDYDLNKELSLVERLKNTNVQPIEYFLYQLFNRLRCETNHQELNSACMLAPPIYDQNNRTISLNFQGLQQNSKYIYDTEKFTIENIKNIVTKLGIEHNKGVMHDIISRFKLPSNLLINKNNSESNRIVECIKIYLVIEIDGILNTGLRSCNGNITREFEGKVELN